MRNVVLLGDVREKLREISDGVVQTCVTSPPYFGLRDYGTGTWSGGDPDCQHSVGGQVQDSKWKGAITTGQRPGVDASTCRKCGAARTDSQIGLEPTPDEYVAQMVDVFREVRRVLRDDGTLWLNLGDSYAGSGRGPEGGLKPKDLIGIPWRVAFALQADGWYLRSDIIWAKGNVMPESVTDRPTKSHEYIFLLTKNERYFYDAEAVKEPSVTTHMPGSKVTETHHYGVGNGGNGGLTNLLARYKEEGLPVTRNRRTVWHINPKPYKGAHFATFPEELPEVCIRAGTSEHGCCGTCGASYRRVTSRDSIPPEIGASDLDRYGTGDAGVHRKIGGQYQKWLDENPAQTVGWEPTCKCPEHDPVPCIVLDPFSGSGTTLAVAKYLRRDYLGCELNPEYHKLIEERLRPAEEMEAEKAGFDTSLELEQE